MKLPKDETTGLGSGMTDGAVLNACRTPQTRNCRL
jgi:hypothetical protein